jgi:hypothetical protein
MTALQIKMCNSYIAKSIQKNIKSFEMVEWVSGLNCSPEETKYILNSVKTSNR